MGGTVELHLCKGAWFPGEIVTGLMLLQFTRRTKGTEFDAWLPFQFPVPPNATPSYEGQIVAVRHAVRAEADLALALDPAVTSPFRIT